LTLYLAQLLPCSVAICLHAPSPCRWALLLSCAGFRPYGRYNCAWGMCQGLTQGFTPVRVGRVSLKQCPNRTPLRNPSPPHPRCAFGHGRQRQCHCPVAKASCQKSPLCGNRWVCNCKCPPPSLGHPLAGALQPPCRRLAAPLQAPCSPLAGALQPPCSPLAAPLQPPCRRRAGALQPLAVPLQAPCSPLAGALWSCGHITSWYCFSYSFYYCYSITGAVPYCCVLCAALGAGPKSGSAKTGPVSKYLYRHFQRSPVKALHP